MNSEIIKKLANGAIENEFNHIQETKELEEVLADVKLDTLRNTAFELLDKLNEVAPEHRELIDDLDCKLALYYSALCRYYFKKGIIARSTNLKFIEDVSIINFI